MIHENVITTTKTRRKVKVGREEIIEYLEMKGYDLRGSNLGEIHVEFKGNYSDGDSCMDEVSKEEHQKRVLYVEWDEVDVKENKGSRE